MAFSARMKDLMKKYGKVALGVHFSVSAASITGLYVAINNNVDVDSILQKVGLSSVSPEPNAAGDGGAAPSKDPTTVVLDGSDFPPPASDEKKKNMKNRTTELAASSGGALALAILCNKALFPIRVPITIALTPPVARFLARRNLIKNHVRS